MNENKPTGGGSTKQDKDRIPISLMDPDALEKKLVGIAGLYVIDTYRKNTALRDIRRVPEIMQLIEDEKTGKLQKDHPLRRNPKYHMFITPEMLKKATYGRTSRRGQFLTDSKEEALLCIAQFHFDPRVMPNHMSLPISKEEIEQAREDERLRYRMNEMQTV